MNFFVMINTIENKKNTDSNNPESNTVGLGVWRRTRRKKVAPHDTSVGAAGAEKSGSGVSL